MENRIKLLHPEGKKAISMEKAKYEVLKNALTIHLLKHGESTHTEIFQTIVEDFKRNNVKFEGSIQWHLEWVKLDLLANKIIERVQGSASQRYSLKKKQ